MGARILAATAALAITACGAAPSEPHMPSHDRPVPADEPRAELHVAVDLPSETACEEDFDLALYRDLSIDLVTWEPPVGECGIRTLTVRYLPRRASEAAVMNAIRKISPTARAVPQTAAPTPPAPTAPTAPTAPPPPLPRHPRP